MMGSSASTQSQQLFVEVPQVRKHSIGQYTLTQRLTTCSRPPLQHARGGHGSCVRDHRRILEKDALRAVCSAALELPHSHVGGFHRQATVPSARRGVDKAQLGRDQKAARAPQKASGVSGGSRLAPVAAPKLRALGQASFLLPHFGIGVRGGGGPSPHCRPRRVTFCLSGGGFAGGREHRYPGDRAPARGRGIRP